MRMIDSFFNLTRAALPFLAALVFPLVGAAEWLRDPVSGLAVWDPDGGSDVVISWSGGGLDGRADGPGVLSWFGDGKLLGRFEGTLVAGKAEGHGKLVLATEAGYIAYEGEFKNHDFNGRGTLTMEDGSTAEGDWVDGALAGWVVFFGADGSRYSGEIKDNVPHGEGHQIRVDGDEYFGEFVNGIRSGKGELLLANGDIYSGEFADDLPNGTGRLVTAEGGIYEGEFADGLPHGRGRITTPQGETAEITAVHGEAEGEITFTAPDGTTRTEVWKDGKEVQS